MKTLKRLLLLLVVLLVLAGGAYLLLNRTDPSPGTAPPLAGAPTTATVLQRGEYLTRAADCVVCHTEPGKQPFSGGVAFKLPFGTIYSSNITADADTGIGHWTDDDFVRAMHDGINADGKRLYPAFPYTSYTALSRDDVLAIKAYLFSLPKISQRPPANALSFPFNQRWAIGFWNAAFFKSKRFALDSSQSPQWNTGAYLATALGHCAECHTPRNFAFAMKNDQALAGATLQGWRAYNITSDKTHGIGGWSDQALTQYLAQAHAEGHGSAAGPMAEVVQHSLQYLKPEDLDAMVTYLRSVPAKVGSDPISIDQQPPAVIASSAAAPGTAEAAKAAPGMQLFAGACASCHQWNGAGRETPYASLLGGSSVNDPGGQNLTQVILHGSDMHVADQAVYMPAFAHAYTDTEIAQLSNFVIAHYGGKTGSVTAKQVGERRQQQ